MRRLPIVVETLLAVLLSAPALAQPPGNQPGSGGAAKEKFTYTIRFATNQQGQPSSACATPMCTGLKALIDDTASTLDFAIYGLRRAPGPSWRARRSSKRLCMKMSVFDTGRAGRRSLAGPTSSVY